jgi:hypothetical protein
LTVNQAVSLAFFRAASPQKRSACRPRCREAFAFEINENATRRGCVFQKSRFFTFCIPTVSAVGVKTQGGISEAKTAKGSEWISPQNFVFTAGKCDDAHSQCKLGSSGRNCRPRQASRAVWWSIEIVSTAGIVSPMVASTEPRRMFTEALGDY